MQRSPEHSLVLPVVTSTYQPVTVAEAIEDEALLKQIKATFDTIVVNGNWTDCQLTQKEVT